MHACDVAHKTLTANQPQATLRSDVTYLRCEIVSKQTDNGTTIDKKKMPLKNLLQGKLKIK